MSDEQIKSESLANARELLEGTTPGPWFAGGLEGEEGDQAISIGCFPVEDKAAQDHYEDTLATVWHNPNVSVDKDETTANARLIAAAPDLARKVIQLEAQLAEVRKIADGVLAIAAEAHTRHFNPGVMEMEPPRYEDVDDMFADLLSEALRLRALFTQSKEPK